MNISRIENLDGEYCSPSVGKSLLFGINDAFEMMHFKRGIPFQKLSLGSSVKVDEEKGSAVVLV